MRLAKDSLDRLFDYGFHIETRTIYLGDSEDYQVGAEMSKNLIKSFLAFNLTPDKPVKIYLNTVGGDTAHGWAIYDIIKSSPCHVTIEVIGQAMSMGAIILQAADERVMHKNSVIMLHDPSSTFDDAKSRDLEAWTEFGKKVERPKMYDILSERTGKPAHFWEKRMVNDYILTAEEAIEEGLADKIFGDKESGSE